jgi:DNA invertase Pin-like site-specific DNA recombinase
VNEPTRAVVYYRLSTAPGNSGDQMTELPKIASARGWSVVATIADQPTGTASARSAHPALDALLRDARFDVLLVQSLSHLASTLSELIGVVNELRNHGAELVASDDSIDTTTTSGSSFFVTFAALAAFEHEQIRQRARVSLDQARRNGVRLGRPSNMNDSVKAAIVVLHEKGVSIRSIARQLRVGHQTVYRALGAATVYPSGRIAPKIQ